MGDLIKNLASGLAKSKWGLVTLFAGAAATVGFGVLPADDATVQTAGTAAGVVAGAGALALAAWGLSKLGGLGGGNGGQPPAPPAVAA